MGEIEIDCDNAGQEEAAVAVAAVVAFLAAEHALAAAAQGRSDGESSWQVAARLEGAGHVCAVDAPLPESVRWRSWNGITGFVPVLAACLCALQPFNRCAAECPEIPDLRVVPLQAISFHAQPSRKRESRATKRKQRRERAATYNALPSGHPAAPGQYGAVPGGIPGAGAGAGAVPGGIPGAGAGAGAVPGGIPGAGAGAGAVPGGIPGAGAGAGAVPGGIPGAGAGAGAISARTIAVTAGSARAIGTQAVCPGFSGVGIGDGPKLGSTTQTLGERISYKLPSISGCFSLQPVSAGSEKAPEAGAANHRSFPVKIRVGLAVATADTSLSLPDGAQITELTTGETLAQLPPQSRWRVEARAATAVGNRLDFSGQIGNARFSQVLIARRRKAYQPAGFAPLQAAELAGRMGGFKYPPEVIESAHPRFSVPLTPSSPTSLASSLGGVHAGPRAGAAGIGAREGAAVAHTGLPVSQQTGGMDRSRAGAAGIGAQEGVAVAHPGLPGSRNVDNAAWGDRAALQWAAMREAAAFGKAGYLVVPPQPEGLVGVNGKLYRGVVLLVANSCSPNRFNVVNIVDVEDYLLSVVPAEMPSSWPLEALKAQAIAARSYALASLGKHEAHGFDVKATIEDQVYGGVQAEQESSNRAVAETAGLVLRHDGKVIEAFFHSASGGHTETAENVWKKAVPYLQAVPDYDDDSPHFNWQRTVHAREFERALNNAGCRIGGLLGVFPVARGTSTRVKTLMVTGSRSTALLSGEQVRNLLKLPSAAFNIGYASQSYVFAGRGYGHGLGLSQWGAKALAEKGYNAPDILSYYYKDVTLGQF